MNKLEAIKNLGLTKFRRSTAAIFVLLFAIIGTTLLVITHAASPTFNIEPENGTASGNVTVGTDSTASGGKYVQFGSTSTTIPGSNFCGLATTAPATYQHVIWIWDENHSVGQIIGNSQAPYINKLATECAQASNYSDLSHPSAPNYVAATSGAIDAGVNDCAPTDCPDSDVSIFQQASSWKSYSEGEPTNCDPGFDGNGYDVNHNPPVYYSNIKTACASDAVALGSLTSGALVTDVNNNTLPEFSFIDPNLNDDMHDGTIAQGDTYMSQLIPLLTNSAAYKSGNTAIFVTFDEGVTTETVPFIVIAPSVKPGTVISQALNHYSLLRTTEEMLGIPTFLKNANSATSMRTSFGI